ncbi:unnamed protein product, partial [Nesidiocoris tenuis]
MNRSLLLRLLVQTTIHCGPDQIVRTENIFKKRTGSQQYNKTMTTPATGEIVLKVDRHAARHSRVHGPRPTSQRRDGLRATLITFGK